MGFGLDDVADAAGGVLSDVASTAVDTASGVADVVGDVADAERRALGVVGSTLAGAAGGLFDRLTGQGHDDERARLAAQQAAAVAAGESERAAIAADREAMQTRDGATTAVDLADVPLFPGPDEDFEEWSHQAIKDMLDGIDVAGIDAGADEVSTVAGLLGDDVRALQADLTSIIGAGWEGVSASAASGATTDYLGRCAQLAAGIDEVGLALRQTASVGRQAQLTVGEPEPFDAGSVLEAGLGALPFGGGTLLPDLYDAHQREEQTHQHAVQVATTWRSGDLTVSGLLPTLVAPTSPVVGVGGRPGTPAPVDPPRPTDPPPVTPPPVTPPAVTPPQTSRPTDPGMPDGIPPVGPPSTSTGTPGSGAPGAVLPGVGPGPGTSGAELLTGPEGPGPTVGHDAQDAGCCCQDCCGTGGPGATGAPAGTSAASLTGVAPSALLGAAGTGAGAWTPAATHAAASDPTLTGLLGGSRSGAGRGAAAPSAASLLRSAGIGAPGTSGPVGTRPAGSFGPSGSASGTFGTPLPSSRGAGSGGSSGGPGGGAVPGLHGTGSPGTAAAGMVSRPTAGPASAGSDGADGGRSGMGGMPMMGGAGGRGKGGGGEHRRADYLVSPEHSAELVGDLPLVAPAVIGER